VHIVRSAQFDCHFGLDRLYRWTRKRDQAQEHLSAATAIYGEMGIIY
jgi:hypothetical protein